MTKGTGPVRTDTLRSKRATAAVFLRNGSGRVAVPVLALVVIVRIAIGGWSWPDALMVAIVALLTGPVEWVLHLKVLHAGTESFATRRLGLGLGHRQHHLDPPELRWLLLTGVEMAIFLALLALVTLVWSLPLAWVLGGGLLGGVVSAFGATVAAATHYEWTHLLIHTAYRPRSRFYARLSRNHRRHHYRNEGYWLGVTSNLGDRLLGTLPAADERVPLSATARTLGADAGS